MYLVKCSCGCFATLGDDYFTRSTAYKCQNCEKHFKLRYDTELRCLEKELADSGFKCFLIPNNARIDLTFDANALG